MVWEKGVRPPTAAPLLHTRPDFKERSARGGSSKSKKKKDSLIRCSSKRAKCKNCKLDCEFRDYALENDPESTCLVPTIRAEAIINEHGVRNFDEIKISVWLGDVINLFIKLYREAEGAKKEKYADILYKKLMPLKEKYFPAIQKQLNIGASVVKVEFVDSEKKAGEEIITVGGKEVATVTKIKKEKKEEE
jgi:hypothetical protein